MSDVIQTVTETFQPGGSAAFGSNPGVPAGPTVSGTWTYQWDVTTNSLVAGQTITGNVVVTGPEGTTVFTSATVAYPGGAADGNVAEIYWGDGTTTDGVGYNKFYMDWGGSSNPSNDEAPGTLYTGDNTAGGPQYTSIHDGAGGFYSMVNFDNNGANGGVLTPVITCFAAGTNILTAAGDVAVETLRAGDPVITESGEAKPVRWLGRSTIVTKFAEHFRAAPIRIKAGALGETADGQPLPLRDLRVSPAHAIALGGVLVQAAALVNGVSIVQETNLAERFTYYHVELASHELLLSEGVATESFVDNVERMNFDNWAEHEALGDIPAIAEMDLPRAKSHRQVPAAVRAAIAERAVAFMPKTAAA